MCRWCSGHLNQPVSGVQDILISLSVVFRLGHLNPCSSTPIHQFSSMFISSHPCSSAPIPVLQLSSMSSYSRLRQLASCSRSSHPCHKSTPSPFVFINRRLFTFHSSIFMFPPAVFTVPPPRPPSPHPTPPPPPVCF